MTEKVTAEQLRQAIEPLEGLTADEIALYLREHLDERAECGHPNKCAVAAFVCKQLGLSERSSVVLSVTRYGLYADDVRLHPSDNEWWVAETYHGGSYGAPSGISEFIVRFDRGEFPELATERSLETTAKALAEV